MLVSQLDRAELEARLRGPGLTVRTGPFVNRLRSSMRVVAEGVENEAQFALLRASGCDEAQGFFLGRPLGVNELQNLFSGNSSQVETGAQ